MCLSIEYWKISWENKREDKVNGIGILLGLHVSAQYANYLGLTYLRHSIKVTKSGFGLLPPSFSVLLPLSDVAAAMEWAKAPMVINPRNSRLGHFDKMCWTTDTTSDGSMPPLFSSPDVFTYKIRLNIWIFAPELVYPIIQILVLKFYREFQLFSIQNST